MPRVNGFTVGLPILLGLTLLLPASAGACTCAPLPIPHAYTEAVAVFSGQVVAIDIPAHLGGRGAYEDRMTVHFHVLRCWKGGIPDTVAVTTMLSDASCGYLFSDGESYLVFAGDMPSLYPSTDRPLRTTLCSGNLPLTRAQSVIDLLDRIVSLPSSLAHEGPIDTLRTSVERQIARDPDSVARFAPLLAAMGTLSERACALFLAQWPDYDHEGRLAALKAIRSGVAGSLSATSLIMLALECTDSDVRESAVLAAKIVGLSPDRFLPAALEALGDSSATARARGACLLASPSSQPMVPTFASLPESTGLPPTVAADTLERIEEAPSLGLTFAEVAPYALHPSPVVREAALRCFPRLQGTLVERDRWLETMLASAYPGLAEAAMEVAAQMLRTDPSLEGVLDLAISEKPGLAELVMRSVVASERPYSICRLAWRAARSSDPGARIAAFHVVRTPLCADDLLQAGLDDAVERVHSAAFESAYMRGRFPAYVQPRLLAALTSGDVERVRWAASLLGRSLPRARFSRPTLATLAGHGNREIGVLAQDLLQKIEENPGGWSAYPQRSR